MNFPFRYQLRQPGYYYCLARDPEIWKRSDRIYAVGHNPRTKLAGDQLPFQAVENNRIRISFRHRWTVSGAKSLDCHGFTTFGQSQQRFEQMGGKVPYHWHHDTVAGEMVRFIIVFGQFIIVRQAHQPCCFAC